MKTKVFLTCLIIFSFFKGFAQLPFIVDSTYGRYGIATPITHGNSVWLHHMLGSTIQSDGKIVLAGTGNFQNNIEVVRLNVDGTLDTTFNHTGFAFYSGNNGPWTFVDIKMAPSGKIMVGYYSLNAGNARFTLRSILPNGAVDASFGSNGKAEIGPSLAGMELLMTSMDVQADGKVILAGGGPDALNTHKYVLARITTSGMPDATFGINGIIKCPFFVNENRHVIIQTVRLQADGKLLAVGTIPPGAQGNPDTMILLRYKTNGTLDSTYGTNGLAKKADRFVAGSIRFDAANNAYIIGQAYQPFAPDTCFIKKFSATGSVVTGFGTNGTVTVNAKMLARSEHEQLNNRGRFELLSDGSMIVAGTSDSSSTSAYRVCKLTPTGMLDTSFSTNGTITLPRGKRDYCSNLLVQTDDKIVLTGFYRTGETSFDTARVLCIRLMKTPKGGGGQPNNVANHSLLHDAHVYPNPVTGNSFTLMYNNPSSEKVAGYSLINIMGQEVSKGIITLKKGTATTMIYIANNLPVGQYFLNVTGNEGVNVFKIMID